MIAMHAKLTAFFDPRQHMVVIILLSTLCPSAFICIIDEILSFCLPAQRRALSLLPCSSHLLDSDDAGDCAAAVKKQQLARSIAASFRGMFIRIFFRLVIVDEGTACKGFTQWLQPQFSPTNLG